MEMCIRDRSQSSRVVQEQLSPVVELQSSAHPVGAKVVRTVEEPVDAGVPVDQQYAGHAEAHAESNAVGIEEHQLAPAIGARHREALHRTPPRADAGQLLRGVGVGPPARDRRADDATGQLAIGLDFENLGHAASVSANRYRVLFVSVGPWHSRSRSGKNSSVKS